ncbi:amidohydrolase [Tabrizicola piscis]|uniref:Amidohydrolase n=1 Tax=Tabrizicola piscis TaxID=2494374 RepID=A0A3S8U9U2_9RHOB|nr:amidohydrolase [Tabrizicola piscis]AZL60340.1 amidohydrolase [Tabrizicola piscis]
MDLIDTHQHLILRDRIGYAWTEGMPALAGDFTREDYAGLVAGKGVAATIFMETGVDDADYQTEARLVAGMVGTSVGGVAMLGQIASIRPEVEAGFDAWLDEARGLGVVGFRRILHVVPDEVSQTATFRRNLRKIGRAGVPFDLNFLSRQLIPVGVDLLRACPDQPFVLDHCGVPDVAAGDWEVWKAGIDAIAPFQNVAVKLSGITAYCAPGTASAVVVRPYVDYLLTAFGPGRMLWGGDWPVVDLGAGLPGWIDMTRQMLADLSADEQSAIFQGTARRVYGV